MTTYEIQNAVNAAEAECHPTARKEALCTVTNETLLALIAAAKECIERRGD